MLSNIAILIAILVLGAVISALFKKHTKKSDFKIKSGVINKTKLPKHQKAEDVDFYTNFICKTEYNDQVKNKKCTDIFKFGG